MKRVVGVDFGEAKIGLAMTDPMQMIAFPLTRLEVKGLNSEQKAKQLLQAIEQYQNEIESIVMGLPLEKSGKEGPMAAQVRSFASALQSLFAKPIHFFDERLTSKQSQKSLKEQGFNRKKAAFLEDQTAACLMLQNFLLTVSS